MTLHLLEVKSLIFILVLAEVNRKNAIVTILAGTQLDSALKLNPLPQIDNCRKMEQGEKKQKNLPCSSAVPRSDFRFKTFSANSFFRNFAQKVKVSSIT